MRSHPKCVFQLANTMAASGEEFGGYNNSKFNSKVIQTNFNYENEKWNVEYMLNNKKHVVKGDYLLIASGFYSDKLKASLFSKINSL